MTRINTDLDVADASKLDFFYQLFTTEMFCYNSWANKSVCSRNDCSSTKPALQEVNKWPCCAQQRVKQNYLTTTTTTTTTTHHLWDNHHGDTRQDLCTVQGVRGVVAGRGVQEHRVWPVVRQHACLRLVGLRWPLRAAAWPATRRHAAQLWWRGAVVAGCLRDRENSVQWNVVKNDI